MLGEGEVELLPEVGRWADVWSSALSCTFIFTRGSEWPCIWARPGPPSSSRSTPNRLHEGEGLASPCVGTEAGVS